MLFGATLHVQGSGCRLRLARSRKRWASMGMAIIMAKCQDPNMNLFDFRIDSTGTDCIRFSTRTSSFLMHAYRNWYWSGEATMPANTVLDENAILFWLLGHFSEGRVVMPGMGSAPALAKRLVSLTKAVHAKVVGDTVVTSPKDDDKILKWMSVWVPGPVLTRRQQ